MGWGEVHEAHLDRRSVHELRSALRMAMKMATAAREVLACPTPSHTGRLAETVGAFERELYRP